MPNPDKPYCVEVDASNYATKGILAQLRADKQWHLVAYLFKSLLKPKHNYNIHNKELLAIIWALESWKHYLEGASYPVDIITNHKNLKYFTNLQKLSYLQAQWALFLTRFNYILTHKPGTSNYTNLLSCRVDHKEGVEEDNLNQVLLDPKFFRIQATQPSAITTIGDAELRRRIWECPKKDIEVYGALNMILTIGPHLLIKNLQEWNYNDSIVLFWGKVYVLNNLKLQCDIAKMHHNLVAPGHPGRFKTYKLLS